MTARPAWVTLSLGDVITSIRLSRDAKILRRAVLESVRTSPDAFLATATEIEERPTAYWENELRSSTWIVLEAEDRIVGIAAAKQPGEKDTGYTSPGQACFIESVWIDPSMRRHGLGERLVNYLVETQRKKGIQQFYLWVFEQNAPAIGLYENMDFKPTGRPPGLTDWPVREVQYVLTFDSDVIGDAELEKTADARDQDWLSDRITYRVLERQTVGSRSRYSKASMMESMRGSSAR